MKTARTLVLVATLWSLFKLWREGQYANLNPDTDGSVDNPWNSKDYCCLYWRSRICRDRPFNRRDGIIGMCDEHDSCYFDSLVEANYCDERFRSPESAKDWCEPGDVWPDCVAASVRIYPVF